MKKRKILALILPLLCLTACGGNSNDDYGPDDEGIVLVEPGDVVSKYSKGDKDHESKANEATKYVRLHYRRNDDSANNRQVYEPWNIWAWDLTNSGNGAAYDFTKYDAYGVYVDLDLSVIGSGQNVDKIGFIVRTDEWSKDPDGDRSIEINEVSPGGIQDVYVKSADSTIFYKESDALKSTISYALMTNFKKINVYFKPVKDTFVAYPKRFNIKINGEDYTNFTMSEYNSKAKTVSLSLNDNLDISDTIVVSYKFDSTWINEVPLMITTYFDTDEFKNNYNYNGDDLGVTFDSLDNPTKTTFKVWAPTSKKVSLKVYNSGDYINDKEVFTTVDMTKGEKGVFSYTYEGDLDGKYYTYEVTNSKGINEVVDPYAKSAGLNGKRGMIVNFSKLNKEIGWNSDTRPNFGNNNAVDSSIYEMHIRDMTINPNSGVSEENRGKYLGLTETGTTYTSGETTVSTGLDHVKELGVTHVQIQPTYDFSSVDEATSNNEMSTNNYNWGYDPQNYNVLEGSYSSDPTNGYTRIKEFKKMVNSFHSAGINVNMDVVYNHTASTENSNFNLLVPYYYYRTYASGSFYNGSGCGNEMASDRYMVNKFVRESCKFYVDEYHISGFRFDLMGLLDNQTMIDVYNDCKQLYSNIMVYGEPWTGGTTKLKEGVDTSKLSSQKTVQSSLAQSYFSGNNVLVGAFNDVIRNAIRGDNNPGRGFVQGLYANGSDILKGIKGTFNNTSTNEANINPNQVLNYVSCHDNYTLYDQLVQTMNETNLNGAYTQAESIVFLSQGVPFLQEGEEFMRSKKYENGKYEGNSYNVGDYINNMDYSLKIKNSDIYSTFKELIKFRKDNADSFCLSSRSDIESKVNNLKYSSGLISYNINDFIILHAAKGQNYSFEGNYKIAYSNVNHSDSTFSGSYTCATNESVVLKKVN